MEVQLLVTGCAAAGAGVLLLLPAGRPTRLAGGAEDVLRVMGRLGGRGPIRMLARWRSWGLVADELARKLPSTPGSPAAIAGSLLAAAWLAVALGLWLLSTSLLGLVVGVACVPVAIALEASSVRRAREASLMREMPDVLRSLSTALGAGSSLSQAIEYVATHEEGRIAAEFERAALGLRCGGTVREALEGIEDRLDVPGVELMTCALLISQRTGSPLRGLFSRSAELVEEQSAMRALLATKTAQVRLSVRIVCAMPVVMVTLLSLISPEFRAGVASARGAACVAVATLLDLVAVLIVRRLMRGVLG